MSVWLDLIPWPGVRKPVLGFSHRGSSGHKDRRLQLVPDSISVGDARLGRRRRAALSTLLRLLACASTHPTGNTPSSVSQATEQEGRSKEEEGGSTVTHTVGRSIQRESRENHGKQSCNGERGGRNRRAGQQNKTKKGSVDFCLSRHG
eukprot:1929531-Rhodomonas_salina.3